MRKPAFCICENKDADQLRGNRSIAERLQRSRKGFLEVANQSPIEISRELSFEHAQKTGRD